MAVLSGVANATGWSVRQDGRFGEKASELLLLRTFTYHELFFRWSNYAIRLCTMNTRNTVHANPYMYTKQETPTPHRRQHPLHRHPHRPHRLPRNPLPDAAVAPLPKDDEIRDAELPDAGGGVAAI